MRSSLLKQLQLEIMGVSPVTYWISHFLAQFPVQLLSMILVWLVLVIFNQQYFLDIYFVPFFVVCILFLLSLIVLNYLFSLIFSEPDGCLSNFPFPLSFPLCFLFTDQTFQNRIPDWIQHHECHCSSHCCCGNQVKVSK